MHFEIENGSRHHSDFFLSSLHLLVELFFFSLLLVLSARSLSSFLLSKERNCFFAELNPIHTFCVLVPTTSCLSCLRFFD